MTFVNGLKEYIRNEPARFIERVRILLFALPTFGFTYFDDAKIGGLMALISIVVSAVLQNKGVRDVVTPYWKVEDGTFTQSVDVSAGEYENSPFPGYSE